MKIATVKSIRPIDFLYETGDRPVQITCTDKITYICKYLRTSGRANKLVAELVGAFMADMWQLPMPHYSFVNILPEHWESCKISHVLSGPAFGCQKLSEVIDVSNLTYKMIAAEEKLLIQLFRIVLFDMWIANEDRTYNNANLLYDVASKHLISIDYGGIFNMTTYDYPVTQLTLQDTILYSELFVHLCKGYDKNTVITLAKSLHDYYNSCIKKSRDNYATCIQMIPPEWMMPEEIIKQKILQLFDTHWIETVWDNFINYTKEAISNE